MLVCATYASSVALSQGKSALMTGVMRSLLLVILGMWSRGTCLQGMVTGGVSRQLNQAKPALKDDTPHVCVHSQRSAISQSSESKTHSQTAKLV